MTSEERVKARHPRACVKRYGGPGTHHRAYYLCWADGKEEVRLSSALTRSAAWSRAATAIMHGDAETRDERSLPGSPGNYPRD